VSEALDKMFTSNGSQRLVSQYSWPEPVTAAFLACLYISPPRLHPYQLPISTLFSPILPQACLTKRPYTLSPLLYPRLCYRVLGSSNYSLLSQVLLSESFTLRRVQHYLHQAHQRPSVMAPFGNFIPSFGKKPQGPPRPTPPSTQTASVPSGSAPSGSSSQPARSQAYRPKIGGKGIIGGGKTGLGGKGLGKGGMKRHRYVLSSEIMSYLLRWLSRVF